MKKIIASLPIITALCGVNSAFAAPMDADATADSLGVNCQQFKRADQCVIAYFNKKDELVSNAKNAIHYRVLYGQNDGLYIGQDFHTSGKKQSNVYFARSKEGLLNSWFNDDLAFEGNVKGYDTKGHNYYSYYYENGKEVSVDEAAAAKPVNDAVIKAAIDATIDAAKDVSDAKK